MCCTLWGRKELDTTEQLNDNKRWLQSVSPVEKWNSTVAIKIWKNNRDGAAAREIPNTVG